MLTEERGQRLFVAALDVVHAHRGIGYRIGRPQRKVELATAHAVTSIANATLAAQRRPTPQTLSRGGGFGVHATCSANATEPTHLDTCTRICDAVCQECPGLLHLWHCLPAVPFQTHKPEDYPCVASAMLSACCALGCCACNNFGCGGSCGRCNASAGPTVIRCVSRSACTANVLLAPCRSMSIRINTLFFLKPLEQM